MQIPDKIKFAGHIYTITLVEDFNDNEDYGRVDYIRHRILLNSCCEKSKQEECFLHELIEIFDDALELKIEHPGIKAMALLLHQFIKDNPEVFKGE